MHEDYIHQPPLRRAAMWSLGLDRAPVPPETLAFLSGANEVRARAYASILVAQGVAEQREGGIVQGPRWDEWLGRVQRVRSHWSSGAASDEMASMQRNVWLRVKAGCAARSWKPCDLSKASGVAYYATSRFLAHGKPPLTAVALVLVARALETTAEELMSAPAEPCSARCPVRGIA